MSFFFRAGDYTVGLHGGAGLNTVTRSFRGRYGVDWRADFLKGLERMEAESPDIFLANHTKLCHTAEKYSMMGSGPDPFVGPGQWHDFLRGLRADFDALADKEP